MDIITIALFTNLTYIISAICKNRLENLAFLISSISIIKIFLKIIIFINKISNAINIAKYLQFKLFKQI